MVTYFKVAKDVLLDAGMVFRNPNYDLEIPYYEKIMITRPEQICSSDETKMELDFTRGGAGSRDRFVKAI